MLDLDQLTGQDFSHCRQWIVDRLEQLSDAFTIEVAAYAIMSNHFRLVLHVDQSKAKQWSTDEVIEQWHKIYSGTFLSRRYLAEGAQPLAKTKILLRDAENWRERLMNIS